MQDVGDVFYYDLEKILALRAFKTVSINQIQLRVYGSCNAVCRSQDRSNQSDRRCIYHSLGTGGGKLYAKTLHRFSSTEREVLGLSLYALEIDTPILPSYTSAVFRAYAVCSEPISDTCRSFNVRKRRDKAHHNLPLPEPNRRDRIQPYWLQA